VRQELQAAAVRPARAALLHLWPEKRAAQRELVCRKAERSAAAQLSEGGAGPLPAEDEAGTDVMQRAHASPVREALQWTLRWPVLQLRPVQQKNYDP